MNRYIAFAATSVKKGEGFRKQIDGAGGSTMSTPQTIFNKIWVHHAVVARADGKTLLAIDRSPPPYSD